MSRRTFRRPVPTTDNRPPLDRLAALLAEPNPERAHRMFGRIHDGLVANPNVCPWLTAARTLHERGVITQNALVYLAEIFMEPLVFRGTELDTELVRLRAEIRAIERAHGLTEDEYWVVDEGPPEWQELNSQWNARAHAITRAGLRECGCEDLARLHEEHHAEWLARSARGHGDVWGEEEMEPEPDWPLSSA